jgi:hypothetical protein
MDKPRGKASPSGVCDITTRGGSVWGLSMTQPESLPKRFGAGGGKWAAHGISGPQSCCSPPMAGGARGAGVACGKGRSMNGPPSWRCPSRWVTFPQGRVRGTKLSLGCSLP